MHPRTPISHRIRPRGESGFSLIETLVVLAIIGILMAMYSTALGKALRAAKTVAAAEQLRQQNIFRMLGDKVGDPISAYRRTLEVGRGDIALITEMTHIVRNDAEFRAYWHTLISPDYFGPVEYASDGSLLAYDPEGTLYTLPPIRELPAQGAPFPVAWDFISTDINETALGNLGSNVLYSNGSVKYVKYPGTFPVTPTVARLSHRYVQAYPPAE